MIDGAERMMKAIDNNRDGHIGWRERDVPHVVSDFEEIDTIVEEEGGEE